MSLRNLKQPFALTLVLLLLCSTADAQATKAVAPETPESVTLQFFEMMKSGKMEDAARLMHPGRLKGFRNTVASLIELARKNGKLDELVPIFGSVKTMDGMKSLDDVHFFATMLDGFMDAQPDAKKAIANSRCRIIGKVAEGKEIVHVIHRTTYTIDGNDLDIVNDCPVRRDGKRWGIEPLGDMESLVVQFEKRLEGKFELPDVKQTRIQYLGKVVENKDQAHVLYRATTPLGQSSMNKLYVQAFKKSDPEWSIVSKGDPAEITRMLKKRNGQAE